MNKLPALRVDDTGIHMACCGPNTWTAQMGSSTVFINDMRPVHRLTNRDTVRYLSRLIEIKSVRWTAE